MVWTTIPNSDVDADSPVTVSLMTALRDNVAAALAQDSGAPAPANNFISLASQITDGIIGQAEIGASAVGQSELKSTTASQSVSVAASGYNEIALTGSSYTMGWSASSSNSGAHPDFMTLVANNDNAYTSKIAARNGGKGSVNLLVYSRYVQASPPYNLGDGDIPLFVYAKIEKSTGAIVATSVAQDPHWAYNGGVLLVPDRVDGITRKKYKNVPQFVSEGFDIKASVISGDPILRQQGLDFLRDKKTVEIEIDHAYQNQSMNVAPHPWTSDNLTGYEVVLLDPSADIMTDLFELHKQFEIDSTRGESINNLLENQYLLVDNAPLTRTMPNGVIACAPRWKNTK